MTTERLYYSDAYLTRFDARVAGLGDDGRRVYLDRTAFYPTSGGQPHDLGEIDGIAVTDVVDEGDRIAHVLATPLEGRDAVVGTVAWERRFDHMQQHTGQHLLSAVFEELAGSRTVSVHFGELYSTLDLDAESLGRDMLLAAERRANVVVADNHPVSVSFEDAAAAAGLRKPSDRAGPLRIVTIDGIDRSACGGTHVRATGEIGAILIRRTEKIRRTTRVEFVCGLRAVARARRDFEALARAATALSAAADDVPDLVTAQAEQLRVLDSERKRADRELAGYRARELYDATAVDATGIRRAVVRRAAGGADDLRTLAQAYAALPRSAFIGVVVSPPSVLLASSDDSGMDAGRALKEALGTVGGRGGGSPRLAQGSVPSAESLDEVIGRLTSGAASA